MKKILSLLLLILLVLSNHLAFAVNKVEEPGTRARKLQRGFTNIALSPLDIAAELSKDKTEEHALPNWATAIGRGSVYAVGRVLVGTFEMLTFFIPDEPILYPEFLWEHFADENNKIVS